MQKALNELGAVEHDCAAPRWPSERMNFVRKEFRELGVKVSADVVEQVVEGVVEVRVGEVVADLEEPLGKHPGGGEDLVGELAERHAQGRAGRGEDGGAVEVATQRARQIALALWVRRGGIDRSGDRRVLDQPRVDADDVVEAGQAFLAKRTPTFHGR